MDVMPGKSELSRQVYKIVESFQSEGRSVYQWAYAVPEKKKYVYLWLVAGSIWLSVIVWTSLGLTTLISIKVGLLGLFLAVFWV